MTTLSATAANPRTAAAIPATRRTARRDNYAAWDIDAASFSHDWADRDKLLFCARYALLAPSGHNTQPWRFITRGDALELAADPSRQLPHSGFLAAEPDVSLGCCLETFVLAARGFGYALDISSPDDRLILRLGEQCPAEPELLDAITARRSNRCPFERTPLDCELAGYLGGLRLRWAVSYAVTRRDDIDFVAEQTRLATRRVMGEPAFRRELGQWVRSNLTKRYDGMPGFTQGMPTPPSLVARWIIPRLDISKQQATTDGDRVANSAGLVLVLPLEPTAAGYRDAGRLYAHAAVVAGRHGVASSGVAAGVLDPETRRAIAARLGLSRDPLALLRLGVATAPARPTPRWPLEAVTEVCP